MGGLIPAARRGGLEQHILGERCKFGPFTFGGGRNFPFAEFNAVDVGNASGGLGGILVGKKSQRQYMQGKKRDRIGGSTTHMDGERVTRGIAVGAGVAVSKIFFVFLFIVSSIANTVACFALFSSFRDTERR